MRSGSNINSLLKKKKRQSLVKKIGLWSLFLIFVISLLILGLTSNRIRIQTVLVSGNSSVSNSQISAIVNQELNVRHAGFIPTDNFFLLERKTIVNAILNDIKTIDAVNISFSGFNTITVSVTERVASDLWCQGSPQAAGDCFLIDHTGFIFAPDSDQALATSTFVEYFGAIQNDPIGQYYSTNESFVAIAGLLLNLTNMGFVPTSFLASDPDEYQVGLVGGGTIMINDVKTFAESLTNLQALVDNGYIKITPAFLEKIDYIDLRYGDKVDFMMKK